MADEFVTLICPPSAEQAPIFKWNPGRGDWRSRRAFRRFSGLNLASGAADG
jgi:hypothetical protein